MYTSSISVTSSQHNKTQRNKSPFQWVQLVVSYGVLLNECTNFSVLPGEKMLSKCWLTEAESAY